MTYLRYRLAYRLLDWGLRLIPDPFVRIHFERAMKVAAQVADWELERMVMNAKTESKSIAGLSNEE